MDRQILNFTANEQVLTVDNPIRISTNKVNYIEARFDLGQNWSGYDSVRAVWFNDYQTISTVLDSQGVCRVPFEVMKRKGQVKVDLVGSISEGDVLTDRLTSYPVVAVIVDCIAQITGAETNPITPSQFEQYVAIVRDLVDSVKDIDYIELNDDYTLTIYYSDGTSYTTTSIRGEQGADGNGIASVELNPDYTLTITYTDGTSYTTTSIRGEKGEKGDKGEQGEVSQAQLDAVVTDLKSDLTDLNAFDVFGNMPSKSGSHNGITFKCTKNKCEVSGTATANAWLNLYDNRTALPLGIEANVIYKFACTMVSGVRFEMYFYNSSGSIISGTSQYISTDRKVTIPSNAAGMTARVGVLSGTAISGTQTVTYHMANTLSNNELAKSILVNADVATKHNAENVLFHGSQETATNNSATFTWNDTKDVCKVVCSATSHASAHSNMFYSIESLPSVFEAGRKYFLKYSTSKTSGQRCLCDILMYRNGNTDVNNPDVFINTNSDAEFVLPEDATGIVIRLRLLSNYVVSETINISLLNAKANVELQNEIDKRNPYYGYDEYSLNDGTHNGLTYTFDPNMNRCHVEGTAVGTSFRNIYYNISKLPDGLKSGDTFILSFGTSNIHLVCGVYFRLADNTDYRAALTAQSRVITVPENAVGMFFRYIVYNGYTLNDDATIPMLVKTENQTIMPFKAKRPLMVSIVDDDTDTDDLVDKFYQNCKHNGVVGAYAVVTKQYINGTSTISKLLDIEADGFNMIPHCYEQKQYLHPTDSSYDPVLAFKNYAQCLRDFKTLGLINPQNLWLIPYGSSDDGTINMGKDLGFDMSFTTEGSENNYLTANDKYRLHRCGLSALADVTDDLSPTATGSMAKCKARVDELVASETGGWLILMTHFNTWQSETWDSTLDSNGYAVGYSRFNELIQYVKDSGCEIVSLAQGASFMKPIIERNFTMG